LRPKKLLVSPVCGEDWGNSLDLLDGRGKRCRYDPKGKGSKSLLG